MSDPVTLFNLVEKDIEIGKAQRVVEQLQTERAEMLRVLIRSGVKHEDVWSLVKKQTVRRTVVPELVQKYYPDVYDEVISVKISIKDLEKSLTPAQISSVVSSAVYETYMTVYDPSCSQVDPSV